MLYHMEKKSLLSMEIEVISFMVKFPRNPSQLNILFQPSSEASLRALFPCPQGNGKSMTASARKVSQVLQRGNRKSINTQRSKFYGNICK